MDSPEDGETKIAGMSLRSQGEIGITNKTLRDRDGHGAVRKTNGIGMMIDMILVHREEIGTKNTVGIGIVIETNTGIDIRIEIEIMIELTGDTGIDAETLIPNSISLSHRCLPLTMKSAIVSFSSTAGGLPKLRNS